MRFKLLTIRSCRFWVSCTSSLSSRTRPPRTPRTAAASYFTPPLLYWQGLPELLRQFLQELRVLDRLLRNLQGGLSRLVLELTAIAIFANSGFRKVTAQLGLVVGRGMKFLPDFAVSVGESTLT